MTSNPDTGMIDDVTGRGEPPDADPPAVVDDDAIGRRGGVRAGRRPDVGALMSKLRSEESR